MRKNFWTTFGQYMLPILSAEGEKAGWINYKTGKKHLKFWMDADNKNASVGIVLTQADALTRLLYFEQLRRFKNLLQSLTGEVWAWEFDVADEHGKPISRIFTTLENVSIYKKEDWPKLISFFKPRMVSLDAFWSQVKYGFDELE